MYRSNLIERLERFLDEMPEGHALAIGVDGDQVLTEELQGLFAQFNRRRDIQPGSTLCKIRTVLSRLFAQIKGRNLFIRHTALLAGQTAGPTHTELKQLLEQYRSSSEHVPTRKAA